MNNKPIVTLLYLPDAQHFVVGMPICWDERPRWYVRLWRRLMKRNYRVATVDHESGTVTLERCR